MDASVRKAVGLRRRLHERCLKALAIDLARTPSSRTRLGLLFASTAFDREPFDRHGQAHDALGLDGADGLLQDRIKEVGARKKGVAAAPDRADRHGRRDWPACASRPTPVRPLVASRVHATDPEELVAASERAETAEASVKKLSHENMVKDQEIASLQHKVSNLEADLEKAEGKLSEAKLVKEEEETHRSTNENLNRKIALLESELDQAEKTLRETNEKRVASPDPDRRRGPLTLGTGSARSTSRPSISNARSSAWSRSAINGRKSEAIVHPPRSAAQQVSQVRGVAGEISRLETRARRGRAADGGASPVLLSHSREGA